VNKVNSTKMIVKIGIVDSEKATTP